MSRFHFKIHIPTLFAFVLGAGLSLLLCFPNKAQAATTYYLEDAANQDLCGLGTDEEDLITTLASAGNDSKTLTTTGHSFWFQFGAESVRASGNYVVTLRGSHNNSGGNRAITILLWECDSGCNCNVINTPGFTCTPAKGESNWTCTDTNNPGSVTFPASGYLRLDIDPASSGHTLQFGNNDGGVFQSTVVIPDEQSVTAPTVATNAETNVTAISATLNGTISNDNGDPADTVGFAWGTSSTLQDAFGTSTESGAFATNDTFSNGVAGLIAGTTYFYRAYGTNSAGTGYGTIEELTAGTDTTPTRILRLFEGFMLRLIEGTIKLYQR